MKARALLVCLFTLAMMASANLAPASGDDKTVVIIKFATHPALDETEAGIIEALKAAKKKYPALKALAIELQNANGNPQLAKQLAESASRPDTDLIIAIATPAAQAVSRTPSKIPLVYGAVADPQGAGILDTGRATGIKNVGINIIDKALSFMRKSFPDARRLGTIYNPAEQNSVYVQNILKDLAPKYGFELQSVEVLDKTQVASSTEVLAAKVDVLYSANDNTINAAVASVVAVTRSMKKPFFLGDLSTLSAGAFASIGLEYHSMGRDVGGMAIELLRGASLSQVPPREPPEPRIWVNQETLTLLKIDLPQAAKAQVNRFVGAQK